MSAVKALIYFPVRKEDSKKQVLEGVGFPFWKASGDAVRMADGTDYRFFILHGEYICQYLLRAFSVGCEEV